MPVDVQGTFVSQKINKIRWIPEEYVKTSHFFTGSWDDVGNSIRVWSLEGATDEEDAEPQLLSELKVVGDVTEMKFIDANKIAVSTSDGCVSVYEVSVYDKSVPLKVGIKWESLHQYGKEECSCTSIDTIDSNVASVGEDGKINILNCISKTVSRIIPEADSCSLHSVCFLTHNELITGNLRGHMKIWDIRKPENKPTASFLLSGDELAATCIINHPTQPHMVLAGSESGSLAVWDLRMNSFPTSLVNAHSAGVTEMHFHPDNPQKLLTCSVSGELWDWNMEAMTKGVEGSENKVATWMPLDDNKTNMMVNSLMPNLHKAINTLHCDRDRIICGADNEAVYLIKNYKY